MPIESYTHRLAITYTSMQFRQVMNSNITDFTRLNDGPILVRTRKNSWAQIGYVIFISRYAFLPGSHTFVANFENKSAQDSS